MTPIRIERVSHGGWMAHFPDGRGLLVQGNMKLFYGKTGRLKREEWNDGRIYQYDDTRTPDRVRSHGFMKHIENNNRSLFCYRRDRRVGINYSNY